MARVGDLLGINYLGTHTMRKTGAYRVYTQSNYNIGLVMHLLNHSSEAMTLTYLEGFCCKVFQKIYFSVKLRKKTETTE